MYYIAYILGVHVYGHVCGYSCLWWEGRTFFVVSASVFVKGTEERSECPVRKVRRHPPYFSFRNQILFLILLALDIQGYIQRWFIIIIPRETPKHTKVFMFLQERMDLHIGA